MNIAHGAFRLWVVLSSLWLVAATVISVGVVRGDLDDQHYVYAPSEDLPPQQTGTTKPRAADVDFNKLSYDGRREVNERARAGRVTPIEMPDGPTLYVDAALAKQDMEYVARLFWERRWGRWWDTAWPWSLFVVLPPAILLALGMAFAWAFRGFARPPSR
jgi:hypothetical protein